MSKIKPKYEANLMTLTPQAIKYHLNENEGSVLFTKEQKEVVRILRTNDYDISLLTPQQKCIIAELYLNDRCFPDLPGQCHPMWET